MGHLEIIECDNDRQLDSAKKRQLDEARAGADPPPWFHGWLSALNTPPGPPLPKSPSVSPLTRRILPLRSAPIITSGTASSRRSMRPRRLPDLRAQRPPWTGVGAVSRTTIVRAMDLGERHPAARQGVTRSAGKTGPPETGRAPRGKRAAAPSWRGPATVRPSRASAADVADRSR
jgi:hypothetical protein